MTAMPRKHKGLVTKRLEQTATVGLKALPHPKHLLPTITDRQAHPLQHTHKVPCKDLRHKCNSKNQAGLGFRALVLQRWKPTSTQLGRCQEVI
mmetsp:Transcript_19161/g.53656  ORF Transcript_19161/g.53656 Transcript_19161/m.53656 type:complete len:93 (+) Transcript_19161:1789-2067(+)